MTKKISLTQGQETIVDDWWYDYLMQWKWQAHWSKLTNSFYAARTEYKPVKKKISMHRVVAQTPDGALCDHINHNTLENTEENLRNVTHSQNGMNKKKHKNNTTGVTGVFIRADRGTYKAQLMFQGKLVLNKEFRNIQKAAQARKEAEEKYFGEYSNKQGE